MSNQPPHSRQDVLNAYKKLGFGPLPPKSHHVDGQVQQASEALNQHPALSEVMRMAQTSRRCLNLLKPLIPLSIFEHLQAGPFLNAEWCVLTPHPAWSAKLRQSLPAWLAHLRSKGIAVERIRIQTLASKPRYEN